MSKAVKFNSFGGPEVLDVVDVDEVAPGAGEVRVRVVTAGINPGEAGIRAGLLEKMWPTKLPCGEGSDFAGVVAEVGDRVDGIAVGDEVIGFSDWRNSQAESITLPAGHVIPKAREIPWDAAGALFVAGTTARANIAAVNVRRGDTVVVAGAAGGVGVLTTQLALIAGAAVVATASKENHAYLESLGAYPVEYGKGLADRIRKIVPDGVDAFIDTHGDGNLAVAMELGVDKARVNTIADRAGAAKYGIQVAGMSTVPARETMIELARLVANGELEVPILATFPLTEVRAAYNRLAQGHGLGKIVLEVSEP